MANIDDCIKFHKVIVSNFTDFYDENDFFILCEKLFSEFYYPDRLMDDKDKYKIIEVVLRYFEENKRS